MPIMFSPMVLDDRIKAFEALGARLKSLTSAEMEGLSARARHENPWFTGDNVKLAIEGINAFLDGESLKKWLAPYGPCKGGAKKVGVVAAGNIPLAGFHDVLCVLLSGHRLMLKTSPKDSVLLRFVLGALSGIEPRFESQAAVVDRLNGADAFIASGGDNSARYFEYYFRGKPHIIRKNRTSVAVLDGSEGAADLHGLGRDIFQYYGLGCRNVSKAFVPEGYGFEPLLDAMAPFAAVAEHHKYRNNYDHNRAIYLVNKVPHLDTGFMLLRESDGPVSPISVLYYETYTDGQALGKLLERNAPKTQCTVGQAAGHTPFGQAQKPRLGDYPDGVDIMRFLYGV